MLSMDRTDALVIMSEVLGVNRAWIAANPMKILTETQDAQIEMLGAQPPALRVTRDEAGDVRAVQFPVGGRTVLVDDDALALAPVTGDLRIA